MTIDTFFDDVYLQKVSAGHVPLGLPVQSVRKRLLSAIVAVRAVVAMQRLSVGSAAAALSTMDHCTKGHALGHLTRACTCVVCRAGT